MCTLGVETLSPSRAWHDTHSTPAADANQGVEMPKMKRPCYEGVHVAVESAVHDGTYWLLFE